MKIGLLLFFLLSWSLHLHCQSKATLIRGQVAAPSKDSIQVGDQRLALSPGGGFEWKFSLSKPASYPVQYGAVQFEVFVRPGETLVFVLDTMPFPQGLRFSGPSSAINQFLLQLQPLNKQVNAYLNQEWVSLFSRKEENFMQVIDSIKNLYLAPLDSLQKRRKGINPVFLYQTRRSVTFSFDCFLLMYPQNHQRFTGQSVAGAGPIRKYLASVELDKEALLEVEEYARFGRLWLEDQIKQAKEAKSFPIPADNQWLATAFHVINHQFQQRQVKVYWLGEYLYQHMENHGSKGIEPLLEQFNQTCQDTALKAKVNAYYQKETLNRRAPMVKTYKQVGDVGLEAFIFLPNDLKEDEQRPAMVYFHGGSWSEGKPDWHFGYSEQGLVNISVEYRTNLRHGVTPFAAVSDAKSLFRWLRQHARGLHIDPTKIIAQGNSAGGHLILCAAMSDSLDEPDEDKAISSKPDALILNAGVYDLSSWNWFDPEGKHKQQVLAISPTHLVKANLPPMLLFHGSSDRNVPFQTAQGFVDKMQQAGNRIDFYPVEKAPHELWFNSHYRQVAPELKTSFLKKHRFL